MNNDKKLSIRLGLFAGITALAVLASTAGSLAWFAYSRTVTFGFVGTSVASSSLLNVGLVDDGPNGGYFSDEDLDTYHLEKQEVNEGGVTKKICWSTTRNGLSLAAIRYYLEKSPYCVDKLAPVTTSARAYNDTSNLTLYRSPEAGDTTFTVNAEQKSYASLPFAFRVVDDADSYVANKSIWLTDATVEAEAGVGSSLRVFVDGENKFLMKPDDAENEIGSTKVGGVLDLIGNGYYDRDANGYEYCYGEFTSSPSYDTTGYPDDAEHDVLVDVNHVGDVSEATTFVAKHAPGAYVPNIDAANPKVQEYYGLGKVQPNARDNGEFYADANKGKAVAVTSSANRIGYSTFTIFVEGWDHSVIDQKANYGFSLGLKFEIDRV